MEQIVVNKQEIQDKLCNKLKLSGWFNKLKGFLLSDDFGKILDTLIAESNKGKKFTPPLKYLLRAFEECKYSDLKVIFIGQDSYPQLSIADGISFSCSLTGKEQPSLKYIFNAIEEEYELADEYVRDVDLKRWSNQGILMLNCGMTCQVNNVGSHIKLWSPFINYVLDSLNTTNQGLIFIFMGAEAQKYNEMIGNTHFKINVEHPNKANYTKGKWNHNSLFKRIDELLLNNYNTKIKW